jgi:methylenetetrahydrofolate--tRNA-(uracil-5-)-methyltransferase
MDRDQYEAFIDALLAAEKTAFKPGETAGISTAACRSR